MADDRTRARAAAKQPKSHTAGALVVVFLAIVFFALIGLLIFSSSRHKNAQQAAMETLTVLPPRIRLRTEPNAKAAVLATASEGEKLIKLEDRNAWVKVQDPDGIVGWTERGLLERTAERERRLARFAAIRKLPPLKGQATEHTQLFAGPGIFYPVIGELSEGTAVNVFTRDHDFYAIDFSGEVAYADIDAIDVSAAGAPQLDVATTQPAPAPAKTATPTQPPVAQAPRDVEEPPVEAPTPTPAPVPAEADRSGVYAAVPPGGTQPEEVDRVIPRYPAVARAAGVGGAVVIRGIVRRDGRIDDVEVIRDLPYGLGEAAREAVRRWRFRPATFRGEPIDVYYTVTVNFRLR